MNTRRIGSFEVAEIGLGCMNLSHAYAAPPSPEEGKRVIDRALEFGVTHFDTAALYGFGANESLVGEALDGRRDRVVLASKCGMTGVNGKRVIDGRPETILRTCDEALRRLRTEVIDIYYLHRWDKQVPIEESVGAMAQLVKAGKVRALGLSEISAATLRKAHAVHPITAAQSEYSLWSRNPEIALLNACDELGVSFVAFSPLGRGFLAGGISDPVTLFAKDIRRGMPRFQTPHFEKNVNLLNELRVLASEAGATPAQLALAWLLQKKPFIVPIVGTTSISHLEEDLGAANVKLTADLARKLEALINEQTVSGPRYPAETQKEIDTEEFA
ncbi:MAG TPA: aldo/keto reductase [Steroidobacteraceae bacterium]|nr:aldo/keto reductase [Steroidobacteraceae bacterium]